MWILKSRTGDFIDFPTAETPFSGARTRIFRSKVISRRIAAQSGIFTVHKVLDGSRFVPLEKNIQFSSRLVKVPVHAAGFASLRKELAWGVNHLSMFPDLDGLGRHLNWRYTWYEDEP